MNKSQLKEQARKYFEAEVIIPKGYSNERNENGLYVQEGLQTAWRNFWNGFEIATDTARAQGAQGAEPVAWNDPEVDPIVSKLYRKFKEWSRQGFGADDVTWCEVRGYVAELLNTEPQSAQQGSVPEEVIKAAVDKFLCRKLPEDFYPDGGVSFDRAYEYNSPHWPVGTNILTAEQTEQMFKDCLAPTTPQPEGDGWLVASSITGSLPKHGTPVIGYNPAWVDADFNPKGIRECFRTGDGTEWISAYWWDEQDCYEVREGAPTLWQPYPQPPAQEGE